MATSSFGKAFRAARRSGRKSFSYNGKSYTTQLANQRGPAPTPRARPASRSASSAPTPRSRPSPPPATPRARPNRYGPGKQSLRLRERQKPGPARDAAPHRPYSLVTRSRKKGTARLRRG